MNFTRRSLVAAAFAAATLAILGPALPAQAREIKLLNVSYDPTRELYKAVNEAFAADWKARTGDNVIIDQSHGGSGKQARAVIDGLGADVVTLALARDIDEIADKGGLLPADWQSKLPDNSAPYTSTIVFLVRKGNPFGIRDWNDLIKPGIEVITPNPKTSGGARWNFLAAWAWAKAQPGASDDTAKAYVAQLYKHVPVLDTGARGSTTTFVQRGIGNVLLAWENEAYLAIKELGADKFEIIYPSVSILAEPTVALIEKNAKKHGTNDVAAAYLNFLYTDTAQDLIAQNYYRPRNAATLAKYKATFPDIALVTIDETFGGWKNAQEAFFNDGGIFDEIYNVTGK